MLKNIHLTIVLNQRAIRVVYKMSGGWRIRIQVVSIFVVVSGLCVVAPMRLLVNSYFPPSQLLHNS